MISWGTSTGLRFSALALTVGLLSSCGGGSDEPGGGTSAGTTDAGTGEQAASDVIVISDFAYQVPDSVAPGATVTIRNEDDQGHTVTSDDESTFDVNVGPGQEVTFTVPEEPGEYPFFCRPHPNMTATLVVEAG